MIHEPPILVCRNRTSALLCLVWYQNSYLNTPSGSGVRPLVLCFVSYQYPSLQKHDRNSRNSRLPEELDPVGPRLPGVLVQRV
jgi:hypothetical protein